MVYGLVFVDTAGAALDQCLRLHGARTHGVQFHSLG